MNCTKSLWSAGILLLAAVGSSRAQYNPGELINKSMTLRSDKMVLVTNMAGDQAGNQSPVIIAASWTDSGRQLECRSLLSFDYSTLPEQLLHDPTMLHSAELILYPVSETLTKDDLNKKGMFVVRRLNENWVDSTTRWLNQPAVDSVLYVTKEIKLKHKNNPVRVDVTKLVMGMFQYGNNGFLIAPVHAPDPSLASGELFGSPKHDDATLRPLLVINYREWPGSTSDIRARSDAGGRAQQLSLQPRPLTTGGGGPTGRSNGGQ